MSTYQDRAKDLLELFKHNVDMNRMEYDRTGVDNYDAILDQALSELASIVEEERDDAYQQGNQEAWSRNVKDSLCFMHEHDVRWCDECRGDQLSNRSK